MHPEDAARRGVWFGPEVRLQFSVGDAPAGGTLGANWRSPIFDLRPELRHAFQGGSDNTQPIWRAPAFGQGGRLLVQISTLDGVAISNYALDFRAAAVESCHVARPDRIAIMNQPQDITEELLDGQNTSVLEFIPPGNPIRYWRVLINFATLTVGAAPNWSCQGVYY